MDILHIASELTPYAKAGGLGDVVAALTKHLRLLGHKVTLVLPRYPAFAKAGLLTARRLTPLAFELGGKPVEASLYDGRLASGVELLLVDVPGLYDRAGIYGEEGRDYEDNALRFATLCRAAVAIARQRAEAGSPFHALHAHDWPAALSLYYARSLERRPAGVLTIHNVAHQGVVPKELVPELGIAWADFTMDKVEFYGHANLLKAGIVSADAVTTVSETYAREIVTPEHGARLEGALARRAGGLVGIVNGVDASVWNPATDGALAARYDVEDVTNKARCKGALLAELGLDVTADRALAVFVGRLVYQKGADLLLAALPKLMASEMSIAIAGDGDPAMKKKLEAAVEKYPGRVALAPSADESQVHRFFAGSDLTIMPSRFEPGGLVQLYAQRYGSVPVAHAVGGICDTVIDCDTGLETGTGFLFPAATATHLTGAVQRALAAYQSPRWRSLVRRVMRLDRGWERPARRYEQVYRSVIEHPAPLPRFARQRANRGGRRRTPAARPFAQAPPPSAEKLTIGVGRGLRKNARQPTPVCPLVAPSRRQQPPLVTIGGVDGEPYRLGATSGQTALAPRRRRAGAPHVGRGPPAPRSNAMLLRPPPRPRRPAPRLVLPRLARGRASVEGADTPPSGVRGAGEPADFDGALDDAFERTFANALEPAPAAPHGSCFFCGVPFNEGEVACWLEYYESRAHAACELEARSGRIRYKGR